MTTRRFLSHSLAVVSVLASALFALPGQARADGLDLDHVNLYYWGGRVLQHVKVVTLFWGPYWSSAPGVVSYFNGFFQNLFVDGRYLANLQQYSAGGYRIGNGQLIATDVDPQAPPNPVTDTQIQSEVAAQIGAGSLPQPDADTVYFVFTSPNVAVMLSDGSVSGKNFRGYHYYSRGVPSASFAYAVIPFFSSTDSQLIMLQVDASGMTTTCSHELAEAVTDPQPDRWSTAGWIDAKNGELGDIVVFMYNAHRISANQLWDTLVALDGTPYTVQQEWSNWDKAPVAFATRSFFPTDGDPFSPDYLTPDKKSRNLLRDSSFEVGGAWYQYSGRGTANASITADTAHDGSWSLLLQAQVDDLSIVWQPVTVKPNTRYLLSGWVRTQGANIAQQDGTIGASLAIFGSWNHAQSVTGDGDWAYVALVFNSGDQTQISVGPCLGFWNSTATGKAWFDELYLIEIL